MHFKSCENKFTVYLSERDQVGLVVKASNWETMSFRVIECGKDLGRLAQRYCQGNSQIRHSIAQRDSGWDSSSLKRDPS